MCSRPATCAHQLACCSWVKCWHVQRAGQGLPCVADHHGKPVVGGHNDAVVHGGACGVARHGKPLALPAAVAIIGHVDGPMCTLGAPAVKRLRLRHWHCMLDDLSGAP